MLTHPALLDEDVLALVLAKACNPRISTFCAAACVCRAWRTASLQCRHLLAYLHLDARKAPGYVDDVCLWLQRYLPSAKTLEVLQAHSPGAHSQGPLVAVVQKLLEISTAAADSPGTPTPTSSTETAAAGAAAPELPPLDSPQHATTSTAVTLPSLQKPLVQLELSTLCVDCRTLPHASVADVLAAAGALTSLRHLTLTGLHAIRLGTKSVGRALFPHFRQLKGLTQLTRLDLAGHLGEPDTIRTVLPPQLLQLSLILLDAPWVTRESWSHFTALTRLHVSCTQLCDEAALLEPPELQDLSLVVTTVDPEWASLKVLSEKLVSLQLNGFDDDPRPVTDLTRLTRIALPRVAHADLAPGLRSLTSLQHLTVGWPLDYSFSCSDGSTSLSAVQLCLLLPSNSSFAPGATSSLGWPMEQLQQLQAFGIREQQASDYVEQLDEDEAALAEAPVSWLTQLSQLSGLRRLTLPQRLAAAGGPWLSQLQALTWLGLKSAYAEDQHQQEWDPEEQLVPCTEEQQLVDAVVAGVKGLSRLQQVCLIPAVEVWPVEAGSSLTGGLHPGLQRCLPAANVYIRNALHMLE